MEEFTHIEKMDAYARRQMSGAERQAFEQALATEPELQQEWSEFQALLEGARAKSDQDLRSQIRQASQELRSEGFFSARPSPGIVVMFRTRVFRWSMAAVLVLAAAVGVWRYLEPRTTESFFVADFPVQPQSLLILIDSISSPSFGGSEQKSEAVTLLLRGLEAFKSEDFDKAEIWFAQSLAAAGGNDPTAQFYLGMSHLAQKRFDEAEQLLQPVAQGVENEELRNEAKFYLAIARSGQPAQEREAKRLMQEIAEDENSDYREAAAEWLTKIGG